MDGFLHIILLDSALLSFSDQFVDKLLTFDSDSGVNVLFGKLTKHVLDLL